MSENFWLGLLLEGADKQSVAQVQRALTDWENPADGALVWQLSKQ